MTRHLAMPLCFAFHCAMLSPMQMQSTLIGSAEACRILQIHPATLMRWVRDGKVAEAHKLPGDNGARLFSREGIERFADELRQLDAAKRSERSEQAS